MKKTNEKGYTFKTENGSAVLTMKGADGKTYSAKCEYPLYTEVFNEQLQKTEIKRQSKKQVEQYLYDIVLGK